MARVARRAHLVFLALFLLVLALLLLLFSPRLAAAVPAGQLIELRLLEASGKHSLLANVDLDRLRQTESRRYDPQYDRDVWMRGVPLEQFLGEVVIPRYVDLAILRFSNGIAIPLAFRDRALMERLRPVVARSLIATPAPFARLVPGEIEDARRPPTPEDLRALTFAGNKLVVADPRHPDVLPALQAELRPFLHADSLVAIELVQRAAWERQLDVDRTAAEGLRVYLGSCRFCHAAHGVGGMLGWDFVDPIPIYSDEWILRMKAGAQELNPTPGRRLLDLHVRFRSEGAGRTMPALRSMTREEVKSLWRWIQAVAERPLLPYTPG